MYIGYHCKKSVKKKLYSHNKQILNFLEATVIQIELMNYLQCPEQPEQLWPHPELALWLVQLLQDVSPVLRRCIAFTIIATTIIVTLTAIK